MNGVFDSVYLWRCAVCGAGTRLQLPVGGRLACPACWSAAGAPITAPTATAAEVYEHETRVRERMTARGGTDRHLVRNGLA